MVYSARGLTIWQYIRAVDRGGLNKRLLDELSKLPNVKLFFNHKLTGADFNKNLAWFERRSTPRTDHAQNPTQPEPEPEPGRRAAEIEVSFDFMVGADGAHSAVRYHLMKFTRMSYSQEYIDTLWCEFHIAPSSAQGPHGAFKISPHHLHIWPGKEFMFIAIPSLDHSFTSTLFLPASRFAELDARPDALVPFFRQHFPGVVPDLLSEADVKAQYAENPHLPLISIKCQPYHHAGSVVILGDAAHAMVPFYGQGMNAGLEDVRVLYDHLDAHLSSPPGPSSSSSSSGSARATARAAALQAYTAHRSPDASAINDLALRNYREMRADVVSPLYRLRKWLEERLSLHLPRLGVATQYSRVSFGSARYSDVERAVRRQGVLVLGLLGVLGAALAAGAAVAAVGWWRWRRATALTKWLTLLAKRIEGFGRRFT